MKLDLHIHTTASDGQYTPGQVVEMCKELDAARIKSLKTTIRMTYEQLMKIDKELSIG